ncbi:MAG: IS4 family transposase [Oligoflexus sp.]|nr:IS4 family transposase [Oligoflexus sp.]
MNLDHFIASFQQYLNEQCYECDQINLVRKRLFNTRLLAISILTLIADRASSGYKLLSSFITADSKDGDGHIFPGFCASSFSVARKKLSPYFFVDLSQWIYRYLAKEVSSDLWFGKHIFAIDGMKVVLPKKLEDDGFDDMGSGSYYPLGMISSLFNLQLGIAYDVILSQHGDERASAQALLPSLPNDSVLIADRGYFSFELLHAAKQEKVDLILRISQAGCPKEISDFIKSNSKQLIVNLTSSLPTQRKAIRKGFAVTPVTVRLISYTRKKKRFVLLTTLLDPQISASDIANLYGCRWDIEEHFKLLKEQMNIQKFKAHSLSGVLQEIFAAIFMATIAQATVVIAKGSKIKKKSRMNYSVASIVKSLRKVVVPIFQGILSLGVGWGFLLNKIIEISKSKFRPGRSYPRKSNKPIGKWVPC